MKINVIGDCAGRYDELMELLGKMPKADLVLGVGDLIDRGPKSKQVVDWFIADPLHRQCVHANHENMALDAHRNYHAPGNHPYWMHPNGGDTTIDSYQGRPIPEPTLRWMEARPMWWRRKGLFVSHAPVYDTAWLPALHADWRKFIGNESSWPWNRYLTHKPMEGHFMLYGHNGRFVEHRTAQGEHYATCLDDSRHKSLMGMHWPTRELFKVDYHQ